MPVSRNALIRYKTIDNCLRNRYRRWTLDDLIEACSDALAEYEGIYKGISRRTIQGDLQVMRSEKLGYNAPIVVVDKKFYTYEDPDYSITNSPLSETDIERMSEAVEVLKQLSGFAQFAEMEALISRLEDRVSVTRHSSTPVIFFERNDHLKGLNHIRTLYQYIIEKKALKISYLPFTARQPRVLIVSPYILKEYRNRWFLLGKVKGKNALRIMALDRIENIERAYGEPIETLPDFHPDTFFDDVIGVTKSLQDKPSEIIFTVKGEQSQYVLTKPLHSSQRVLERHKKDRSITFAMNVVMNYELERVLLGYGDNIKILQPPSLARQLQEIHRQAAEQYDAGMDGGTTISVQPGGD
jgi:predicted DNA-binding transcriptional regulator YafY